MKNCWIDENELNSMDVLAIWRDWIRPSIKNKLDLARLLQRQCSMVPVRGTNLFLIDRLFERLESKINVFYAEDIGPNDYCVFGRNAVIYKSHLGNVESKIKFWTDEISEHIFQYFKCENIAINRFESCESDEWHSVKMYYKNLDKK